LVTVENFSARRQLTGTFLSDSTAGNTSLQQWRGAVYQKFFIFVQHLVPGTGRGFECPPLLQAKRWPQLH
jgi:hypothetical protein